MAVLTNGGTLPPGQFKLIANGTGTSINDPSAGHGSGSSSGQEIVPAVNTVGAIGVGEAPTLGGDGQVELYSAFGGSTLLFDSAGNQLPTPLPASGTDFVAPDGSGTSLLTPFFGTAAAAPEGAAVAALMLEANPWLTSAQVSAVLTRSTLPVGGVAATTGSRLVWADTALRLALGIGAPEAATDALQASRLAAATQALRPGTAADPLAHALASLSAGPTAGPVGVDFPGNAWAALAPVLPGHAGQQAAPVAGSFIMLAGADGPIWVPDEPRPIS